MYTYTYIYTYTYMYMYMHVISNNLLYCCYILLSARKNSYYVSDKFVINSYLMRKIHKQEHGQKYQK
jgi:hypothetical protein